MKGKNNQLMISIKKVFSAMALSLTISSMVSFKMIGYEEATMEDGKVFVSLKVKASDSLNSDLKEIKSIKDIPGTAAERVEQIATVSPDMQRSASNARVYRRGEQFFIGDFLIFSAAVFAFCALFLFIIKRSAKY